MRLLSFLACLLFISADQPPCKCNLLLYKSWNEHTPMKTIDKEIRKTKRQKTGRNYYKEADLYFLKAWKLYKENSDSLAKVYFLMSIDLYKIEDCHRSFTIQSKRIMHTCIANYYTDNYEQAIYYYRFYARLEKLPTTCPEIYYLESLKKINPGINIDSVKHIVANDDSHKLTELNNCNCF